MSLEARAVARWVGISPRKMRLVVDMVRGSNVRSAVNKLHFSNKGSSGTVAKTIRSALANLMSSAEAAKLDPSEVYIKEIRVDEGPTLRRWRPRAMGRASRIRKRSSHLTVVVAAREKPGK